MPSHLSDVGFKFSEENFYDELIQTFESLMRGSSREITVGDNTYLVLYLDRDIEFWLPVGENRMLDPTSFELHFNTHRWDDIVNPSWESKENRDMQGIVSLWDANESYSMNVTVPNAICVPELREGKAYKAQITCFAEAVDVYKNEEDFHKDHDNMGTQAFIPIGQFGEMFEDEEQSSRAWFSGIVKKISRRTNSYTKNDYYHLLVESYDMSFDVLVDATCVESVEIGDIISVTAWLSVKLRVRYQGDDFATMRRQKEGNEKLQTLDDLYNVLRKSWCKETAYPSSQVDWEESDPSYGQCAITAMLVHDMFGGTIHRIRIEGGGTHYFNYIDGHYIDLTREQFDLYDMPIQYEPNEKMSREYCGKNANTKSRYDMLIKRVLENVK